MKIVSRSTLQDYAINFLENEKAKVSDEEKEKKKKKEIEEVQRSRDPVSWLKEKKFGYKLPKEQFSELFVVRIESLDELERIRIYDWMVSDKDNWWQEHQLSPLPDPSKPFIGALADYFLAIRYFGRPPDNTGQYKRYHEWKSQGHLIGAISRPALPLIQPHNNGPDFEIVDGWGRLLAYAALCKESFKFVEFECFLATDTQSANNYDMHLRH